MQLKKLPKCKEKKNVKYEKKWKKLFYRGYDKDTFVFIGIRGQEVRMHRLSFDISTLPPRYRYG